MNGRVLFVCTGNICRSPLAEVLARQMYGGLSLEFLSAGIAAPDGRPASEGSCLFAASLGLDLDGHRSRPLTPGLLHGTSWVIGMTSDHAAEIHGRWGAACPGRIGALGAPGVDLRARVRRPWLEEVADPFGLSPAAYRVTGLQIQRLLTGWAEEFLAAGRPREDCG